MNRHYVYVLKSLKDGKFYIGYTADLKRRLQEHAKGMVTATRRRRFLQLTHYEYFVDRHDAKTREVFLKSGAGHQQLRDMLKHTFQ